MKAEKLALESFRNYEKEYVLFDEGLNIIVGQNGAGKTNLAEALYAFSYARSFRSGAKDFIRHGEDRARIALEFESEGRKQSADIVFAKDNKKRIRINEIEVRKTSELLGKFICVLFTPDEMSLVKGGPECRRKMLDTSISALKPKYFSALCAYNTCVKQKNALLKSKNYATLDVWNEKIAEYGAFLCVMRKDYIKEIEKKAKAMQSEISGGKEELEIIYSTSYKDSETQDEIRENILKKTSEACDREKELGMCLTGPHRDDMVFKINSFNARRFASQGQARSIVLSVKDAQTEIMKEHTGEYPLLLLDDVLSELDGERKEYFTEKIKGKQSVITTTDAESVNLGKRGKIIKIEDGRVCM
ncbi:MAG: DNA replication/repair protein RecF [Clostridia bacterium]|nr:DNA replication/repair protein RecF [Clostridia bacterium]